MARCAKYSLNNTGIAWCIKICYLRCSRKTEINKRITVGNPKKYRLLLKTACCIYGSKKALVLKQKKSQKSSKNSRNHEVFV